MRYIRPRPWRPRGPWLNGHPSVRRRGHFYAGQSTPHADSAELPAAFAGEDRLLAEQSSLSRTGFQPEPESILPARIDEMGLLAARAKALGERRQQESDTRLEAGAGAVHTLALPPGDESRPSA